MAEFDSLPQYLATVKNVRGLAVYDPDAPPDRDFFTWLSRRHQYRNVGIPPRLVDHPSVDLLDYKTFETVGYPFESLGTFADRLAGSLPAWVAESLVVGASHVTPLFLHHEALPAFEDVACWRLVPVEPPDDEGVLRHMRIAGYGMLDFLETTATEGRGALADEDIEATMADRAARAREDGEERFWRLLEREDGSAETDGTDAADRPWVGGYFDILPHVTDDAAAVVAEDPDVAVALGLVGGFVAGPDRDLG